MITSVHQLISHSAQRTPNAIALVLKDKSLSYLELQNYVNQISTGYQQLSIEAEDRIGIYLPKTFENVACIFASSLSDAIFVPINSVLKAPQVKHILTDCTVKILVTNQARFLSLQPYLADLPQLTSIIITDLTEVSKAEVEKSNAHQPTIYSWHEFLALTLSVPSKKSSTNRVNSNNNIAAILYTSGSTGKPKGVVISHNNLIIGAESVSEYLHNTAEDRILAVLPLSFDYGLSQLTTCFLVGARCVLLDYLLPNDVLKAITKHDITGLAAVPPLWHQLAKLSWKDGCGKGIRYFTNSGGALSTTIVNSLRQLMPNASPYLMYGLTEAFRSTYLPPEDIDLRVNSIGKAIPNANVFVIKNDGKNCDVNEPGELVHTGPLVTLGYWNDNRRTLQRFKTLSSSITGLTSDTIAVFSGDTVIKDSDGYFYFVARNDEMIKTSGYRVSPTEVEDVLYQHTAITEAAVLGIPHEFLGQTIIAIVSTHEKIDDNLLTQSVLKHCQQQLANYMIPKKVVVLPKLPHNANGKIDRNQLHLSYMALLSPEKVTNTPFHEPSHKLKDPCDD